MIRREITETIVVRDAQNKLKDDTYVKTVKIFGITVFHHTYILRESLDEKKQETPIGFTPKKNH